MQGTCSIDGCEKPHSARGFCKTHYKAWRDNKLRVEARAVRERNPKLCAHCSEPIPATRTASAIFCSPICKRKAQHQREKQIVNRPPNPPCTVDGCSSPIFAVGICSKHYTRMRTKGTLDDTRKNARGTCTVEGCEGVHLAGGMCETHYRAERRSERRERVTRALADRKCIHCEGPMGPDRGSRAMFCSRKCKQAERVESGRAAEASMRYYFGSQYGLTPEQVEEMARNGCNICGTQDWRGRHNRPHVDHDHKSGLVRGVLCGECNLGIGKFRDDPALLQRAAAYLQAATTEGRSVSAPLDEVRTVTEQHGTDLALT